MNPDGTLRAINASPPATRIMRSNELIVFRRVSLIW
jgi:hypothetical protein